MQMKKIFPAHKYYNYTLSVCTIQLKTNQRKTKIFSRFRFFFQFCSKLKLPESVLTDVELGDVGDSPVCGSWTYICHARPILSLISGGYQGDIRKYYRDILGYRTLIWPRGLGQR